MVKGADSTLQMRHHRQELIPGWRQDKLTRAVIGVVGSGPFPTSFFLTAAVALGIRRFVVVCPQLHETFVKLAHTLDPGIELAHLHGWLTHPAVADLLAPCTVLVDFSQLGLSNKILFNAARERSTPLVTVRCLTEGNTSGFRLWSYVTGRETAMIRTMISRKSLTAAEWNDPATAMAAAGVALEELKRILFGDPPSVAVVEYVRRTAAASLENIHIAVVGAGALGNFAASTLVLSGCRQLTLFDPDRVDVTNLNRQIFFAHDVGAMKAPALAHRLNTFFGARARGIPEAFDAQSELTPFDAVLDCVDNFETRLLLSRRAQEEGKILISGGTGPDKGQVVAYHPRRSHETPAQLLHMDRLALTRRTARQSPPAGGPSGQAAETRASCLVQADPSVVMSNQIIGALMADILRRLLSGENPGTVFYESSETHGLRLTTH